MRVATRWFLRLALALINIGAGFGKGLDTPGFVRILATYELFPGVTQWPIAIGAIVSELALGVWLLTGWRLREAALVCAAINAFYGVALTTTLLRGIDLNNCGCFGVFLARPLRWYSPLEDVVLVIASIALFFLADARRARKLAAEASA